MNQGEPLLREHPDGLTGPAIDTDIAAAESAIGYALPRGSRTFLLFSDGYDDVVGSDDACLSFWPVRVVADGGYDRPAEAGVVLIGSNGGPTGFGFQATEPSTFVSMPLASTDADEIRVFGHSFAEFVRAIADGEGW